MIIQYSEQLLETKLARVFQHSNQRNMAIITASRGNFSDAENRQRNKALEQDIRDAGYGFARVSGAFIENKGNPPDHSEPERTVREDSYIVLANDTGHDGGKLRDFAVKMGMRYGQEAVLHKQPDKEDAELIGTMQGGYPGMSDLYTGSPESLGDIHPGLKPETIYFTDVLRRKRENQNRSRETVFRFDPKQVNESKENNDVYIVESVFEDTPWSHKSWLGKYYAHITKTTPTKYKN